MGNVEIAEVLSSQQSKIISNEDDGIADYCDSQNGE